MLRRFALFLASSFALALILTTPAAAQPASIVRALLDDAAEHFDIPHAVLYGVAYNESRWRDIPADSILPSCTGMPPAYGIMGLRDDDYFGHSLHAGLPLGISPEEAMKSIEKNIIAGAYHLSTLFDGADRADFDEWLPAIGRYPGIPAEHEALRLLYIDGVLELLRRGWYIDDQYLPPRDVPAIDRQRLEDDLEAIGLSVAPEDYPGATWKPSPNFSSRGGSPITAITIHDTEGGFAGSLSWLTSTQSQASAHYMVRSVDGYTVQMVRESEKAWHVRNENPYAIGIEHEGYVARPEFFTPEMYTASAALTRFLIGKHGIPLARTHVKGHLDFPNNSHTDPGGWWDWPMYYRMIDPSKGSRVVIDPFEDNVVGWWDAGLSGSTSGVDTERSRFSIKKSRAHAGASGGELSYAFTGSSDGVARFFRSGHGNTSDGLLNVGSSGYLTLALHGDGSGNQIELWFYDSQKRNKIVTLGAITWNGWRTISTPVSALDGGGPYRFHSIVIRQVAGAARSGAVGVDELAHRTTPLGVDDDHGATEALARKFALRSSEPMPEELRKLGEARIISTTGEEIARFERLPDTEVGRYLRTGVYMVMMREKGFMVVVGP